MIDMTKITDVVKNIEQAIEERFGEQAGYQQVKSVLQGKAPQVDTRSLVTESRAAFSGDNKPELLATTVMEGVRLDIGGRLAFLPQGIDQKHQSISNQLEKDRAILENRASRITYEVKETEGLLAGRFVGADGVSPVAGATVVVRGTGAEASKIVGTAVTDENGEYVIHVDEKTIAEAPKRVSIAFETPGGENLAETKALPLTKGKATTVDAGVPADKEAMAADLVGGEEVRKESARLEMAELQRSEAELRALRFHADSSMSAINAKLDGLKNLFGK